MRGGVAQPVEALDRGEAADQPGQVQLARAACAVIGVDVLAQQHDLAGAGGDEAPRLGLDCGGRTRLLGPAGVGHDAEGAEAVAALLNREERRDPPSGQPPRQLLRQVVEARFRRHGRIHAWGPCTGCARHHGRQPVIGLRPHDDIDIGRARRDLGALGLGDAAGDGEQHLAARALARPFQRAQAPELGIDLFRRLLADVAGVEDDQVGVLDLRGRAIAERRQDIRHAGGVVDVHLAAEGLDVEFFGHGLAARRGIAFACAARQSRRCPPRSQAADPSTHRSPVKQGDFLFSLKRRALAPLAWLRALRRAGSVAPAGPLRGPVPLISRTLGPPGTRAAGRLLSLSAPGGGEGRGEVGVLSSIHIPQAPGARSVLFHIPQAPGARSALFHIPQAPGARSARLATRLAARRRGRAGRAAARPGPAHLPHPVCRRVLAPRAVFSPSPPLGAERAGERWGCCFLFISLRRRRGRAGRAAARPGPAHLPHPVCRRVLAPRAVFSPSPPLGAERAGERWGCCFLFISLRRRRGRAGRAAARPGPVHHKHLVFAGRSLTQSA